MGVEDGDITVLLRRWKDGSVDAENELFRLTIPELQKLAHHFMRGERKSHTLNASCEHSSASGKMRAAGCLSG
jgi:hypothetical protein